MHALDQCRSLLFMPASNSRAMEKARTLPCDAVVLDLEDAVAPADKAQARVLARAALAEGFGDRLATIRVNACDSAWHGDDLAAVRGSGAALLVLPKVESARDVSRVADAVGLPLVAMIESAAGLVEARAIAAAPGCAGLFAGTNDIAATMRLRPGPRREGLELALQTIVLAAAAAGVPAFDGVCNRIDDAEGFAAECAQAAAYGFRGKTLIHPGQVEAANRIFLGDAETLAADARLLAAVGDETGAVRFEGRMIEALHVAEARERLARAAALGVRVPQP